MTFKAIIAACILATVVVLSSASTPTLPHGWLMAGSIPTAYEAGIETRGGTAGGPTGFLKSKADHVPGFGTLMQSFSADDYRGKRVRFSASLRAESLKDWGSIWMRIDDKNGRTTAFDNMNKRPIKGTAGWQTYEIVLDVAPESQLIALGLMMGDAGQIWIDQARLEIVPLSVPVTDTLSGAIARPGPVNLDFTR